MTHPATGRCDSIPKIDLAVLEILDRAFVFLFSQKRSEGGETKIRCGLAVERAKISFEAECVLEPRDRRGRVVLSQSLVSRLSHSTDYSSYYNAEISHRYFSFKQQATHALSKALLVLSGSHDLTRIRPRFVVYVQTSR